MLKLKLSALSVCALFSVSAISGTMGPVAAEIEHPFYAGLGGSYNSITMNNKLYAFGISNTYTSGVLSTYGSAAGYSNQLPSTQTTFAPQVQAGYQKHFSGRKEFWGFKTIYQFLNAHNINQDIPIAQYGSYTNAGTGLLQSSPFAGNVVAESAEVITNHQLNFFALMGHSFKHSDIYLGAGPSLFGMQSKINKAWPYANIDGISTAQSDYPISYSKTMWVWGGGAQLGATYHLTPSWFLDFNYSYAATSFNTIKNPILPIGKRAVATVSSSGILYANSSQSPAVQSLAVTINKKFG